MEEAAIKKIVRSILCVALLSVVAFAAFGCDAQSDGETVNAAVYWNLNQDAEGVYILSFLKDGQTVTYHCADAQLVKNICLQDVLGLDASGRSVQYGGSISGGKSAKRGSAVFVSGDSTVKICGNPQVWDNEGDNIYLSMGAVLEIDEFALNGASVGISMENPGALGFCGSVYATECLFSDDPNYKITQADNGLLALE